MLNLIFIILGRWCWLSAHTVRERPSLWPLDRKVLLQNKDRAFKEKHYVHLRCYLIREVFWNLKFLKSTKEDVLSCHDTIKFVTLKQCGLQIKGYIKISVSSNSVRKQVFCKLNRGIYPTPYILEVIYLVSSGDDLYNSHSAFNLYINNSWNQEIHLYYITKCRLNPYFAADTVLCREVTQYVPTYSWSLDEVLSNTLWDGKALIIFHSVNENIKDTLAFL